MNQSIPAQARNFVIAAMVSASLLKLAEGMFNSVWSAVRSEDAFQPQHVLTHLSGEFTFVAFLIYVFTLVARHFAQIYAPEMGGTGGSVQMRQGILALVDFVLTACLLTALYILAHGVAEAARGSTFDTESWPLAAFGALICVLLVHGSVSLLNWRWAHCTKQGMLAAHLKAWTCINSIELINAVVALLLSAWSASFAFPVAVLLLMSLCDFWVNSSFWRSLKLPV